MLVYVTCSNPTQCAGLIQSGSSALHVTHGPMTVAPYPATSVYVCV
jgi:hypothetical protein